MQNCTNTKGYFFNDETCLMKELTLLFKVFVIFHHVHSLYEFILVSLFMKKIKIRTLHNIQGQE